MSKIPQTHLQQLSAYRRTDGDGMETTDDKTSEANQIKQKENLMDRFIYRPPDLKEMSFSPPPIKGQIVHLFPKNVTPQRKEGMFPNVFGGREPKFVPYEPYKAAVKPIIPYKHKKRRDIKPSQAKAVVDESNDTNKSNSLNPSTEQEPIVQENETDFKQVNEELTRLKEENEQLESQLKFQAQVNAELKNLLVAAMGEDLETRVHLLTEDKLHLARALLNSAQKLSTHQEQTEYLANQCEVWQSKFLASSLMVEELAKWKAALCQKASELQETMRRLIEERKKVRESLISSHSDLTILSNKFDLTALRGGRKISDLKSSNILDLSSMNQVLSSNLRIQLLGDETSEEQLSQSTPSTINRLEETTPAERLAEQQLLHPLAIVGQPDAACNAVVGAAMALGSIKLSAPAPACCAHCSGQVKTL
ncbi:golgin-45 [Nilaparvata lugens]|uniref:golgin-45 n=1 Tax=Nilaparvata lugens TaxID=108931 RepID=UPI00193D8647|nr:golgin-45 [Nilaparvata lugens]XP_039276283.1 golgin-45 [Nilaparvata lugens]